MSAQHPRTGAVSLGDPAAFLALRKLASESSMAGASRVLGISEGTVRRAYEARKVSPAVRAKLIAMGRIEP